MMKLGSEGEGNPLFPYFLISALPERSDIWPNEPS